MKILALSLYVFSFIPRWYEDKWAIRSIYERPSLIDTPNKQFAFLIVNTILRYGTPLLVWYAFTWRWALIAFVGGLLISRVPSQIYFNRESEKWIQLYKTQRRAAHPSIEEKQLRKEADNYAAEIIHEHTKAKR